MGIDSKFSAMADFQNGAGAPVSSGTQSGTPNSKEAVRNGAPPSVSGPQILGQVRSKLEQVVQWRKLQGMYPPDRLDALAQRVASTVDFTSVAQDWRLPTELALDFCSLALFDIIIYADDSGSMAGPNWNYDLREIVHRTAAVSTLFDADGIGVRFMNSDRDADNVMTKNDVMSLLDRTQPGGGTPMGTSMRVKILEPYLRQLRYKKLTEVKPLLVITVTDGAPSGERRHTIVDVIKKNYSALRALNLEGMEVAFQFAQVGTDTAATAFLDELDCHPEVGPFVDATSNFEMEADQWHRRSGGRSEMTRDLYLLKLLCGAVDNEWDAKDEEEKARAASPLQPQASHLLESCAVL